MSFKDFIKTEMPEFVWNWHHDVICNEIDRTIFRDGENQPENIMILAPPRSSKSTLCSILLPAYITKCFFYNDIMVFSSTKNIAEHKERVFKRKFGAYLNNIQFREIGNITGHPIDHGIIDTTSAYTNEEYGNKIWDWYCSVYNTRKSQHARTILTCSNTEYSLANYILSRDKQSWTVIRISALSVPVVSTNTSLERSYWEANFPTEHLIEMRRLIGDNSYWKYTYQQEIKDIPYENP